MACKWNMLICSLFFCVSLPKTDILMRKMLVRDVALEQSSNLKYLHARAHIYLCAFIHIHAHTSTCWVGHPRTHIYTYSRACTSIGYWKEAMWSGIWCFICQGVWSSCLGGPPCSIHCGSRALNTRCVGVCNCTGGPCSACCERSAR